ncbi:hypothetical protein IIA79_08365, partial [bacterium]|nr:hypothetical protein [bacterium]
KSGESSTVAWELAGKFGGQAKVSVKSDDPWEVRYAPGGFVDIAGVCATSDEVWVCDLGISRIQVFDFDGRVLRTIGSGVPMEGTLLTDAELYREYEDFERGTDVWWQDQEGARWVGQEESLFRAADVVVGKDGFWIADWVKTQGFLRAKRYSSVIYFPSNGEPEALPGTQFVWPAYLAWDGKLLAATEPRGNGMLLFLTAEENKPSKKVGGTVEFRKVMEVQLELRGHPRYQELHFRAASAGLEPGSFYGLGGVAVAFDKVVACDMSNRRLQVFEARRDDEYYWGKVIRIIAANTPAGKRRFENPKDVDISAEGDIFVLDIGRLEVGILNSRFERVGGFARGELVEPHALDISDDGKHCFITDNRTNQVLHYARRD